MKVLICGSRHWRDIHAIRQRILKLPPTTTIVHGGARGADRLAGWLAEDLGFTVREMKADGQTHGKRAGFLRNLAMLDEKPDLVIAFQVDGSAGTQHAIDQARKRGISVEVHRG